VAGWWVTTSWAKHALEVVIEEDRESLASVFIQTQERDDFTVAQPIPFRVRTAARNGAISSADATATGQSTAVRHGPLTGLSNRRRLDEFVATPQPRHIEVEQRTFTMDDDGCAVVPGPTDDSV